MGARNGRWNSDDQAPGWARSLSADVRAALRDAARDRKEAAEDRRRYAEQAAEDRKQAGADRQRWSEALERVALATEAFLEVGKKLLKGQEEMNRKLDVLIACARRPSNGRGGNGRGATRE